MRSFRPFVSGYASGDTDNLLFVLLVQHLRAAVHQLHQRASAAILQPPHVRSGAGGVQEGRYPVGVHRFRYGFASLYRAYREGE